MSQTDPWPGSRDAHRGEPGYGPHPGVTVRTRVHAGPGGLPPRLHLAVTDLTDRRDDLPWLADRQAFGTAWDDPGHAARAARAEAVERFCGAVPPDPARLVFATFAELTAAGRRCVDPRDLVLYSARQYATPGFPFVPFGTGSPAYWIEGRCVESGRPTLVPAFLVYSGWRGMPRPRSEPAYSFPVIGGIAAGETYEHAVRSALGEVVERDAAACWWAQAASVAALPLPDRLAALAAEAGRDFEVRLLALRSDFGLPVFAAGVRDTARGWLTYGTAAAGDFEAGAAKALAEAYTLQLTCQALDDPRTVVPSPGRKPALKPWRADRRYLDSYRPDCADVVEQICHQQLYLDHRAAGRVARWAWDLPPGRWTDLPPAGLQGGLLSRVAGRGHAVVAVDLTTPEATAAGLHVARVVVPGTVGAAPAAYPFLGGRRLREAGVRLGYRVAEPAEAELNTFPMPHS